MAGKCSFRAGIAALTIALLFAGAAAAMTINAAFDPTFLSDFGSNASAAETAFNTAAAIFTSAFDNPIAININVTAVADQSVLGSSSTAIGKLSWANLEAAVVANDLAAGSDAQLTSIGPGGSITAADPTSGSGAFWVTKAQAKALGIIPNDSSSDGTITVGAGFTYTYDESAGVAPGTIDLVGVFAHEMSEIMGRIGLSGSTVGSGISKTINSYTLLDALSFQGPGVRGLGNGVGNWLSIEGGSDLLMEFNDQQDNSGDSRDWAAGSNDSFNAFSSAGVTNPVTPVDLEAMNVLGYDLTPEPSTGFLLATALAAGCMLRRRAGWKPSATPQ